MKDPDKLTPQEAAAVYEVLAPLTIALSSPLAFARAKLRQQAKTDANI